MISFIIIRVHNLVGLEAQSASLRATEFVRPGYAAHAPIAFCRDWIIPIHIYILIIKLLLGFLLVLLFFAEEQIAGGILVGAALTAVASHFVNFLI